MAKKKAKKKRSARRKAGARSSRGGSTLRGVPTSQLQAELERRASDLDKLEAKREELMAQVEEVESEISTISAALGAGGGRATSGRRPGRPAKKAARGGPRAGGRAAKRGKRPRNAESLEVALAKVLKGKTMGVSEVADAVQKAGYKTTSPNFRTIVNQTLLRSDLIKKTGRGAYTAA